MSRVIEFDPRPTAKRRHMVGVGLMLASAIVGGSREATAMQVQVPPAIAENPATDGTRSILADRIENLRAFGEYTIDEERIIGAPVIPMLYENRDYTRVWTDPSDVQELLRAVRAAYNDGLDPADYHEAKLQELLREIGRQSTVNPNLVVDFDLLMTDALARLVYHVSFGKVDPEQLESSWNMAREFEHLDPAAYFQGLIDSPGLYDAVEGMKPQHEFYTRLKEALQRYREIEDRGGWPTIPAGESIEAGMSDARVPLIRDYLTITGDYTGPSSGTDNTYEGDLVDAVRLFQHRHGLPETALIGQMTIEALNVPVQTRIDQLRISLERGRWVLHDLDETFIATNIAGFKVYFVRDNELVWETRAQVGRAYRKTPVFKSELEYIQFNPTWTVPPGILGNDILPRVREDSNYLSSRGLKVLDRSGNEVDPNTVDWNAYTGRTLPYRIRQDPGPTNALGRVKFIFPNQYIVFLHDTPSRALFDRATRTFSSGCVRIENPFQLAELLLNDPDDWSMEAIEGVVASRETKTVFTDPIAVLLLYWTADVDLDGHVHFYTDVYERDGDVLEGLNGEFRLRERELIRN